MGSDSILAGIGATVLAVTLLVCGFAACCLPVTTASLAGAVSTGADSPYTHEQLVELAQETRAFTVDAHSSMEEARESLAADVVAAAREASAEGAPKYSQWTQQAKQVLGDAEGEGGAVAADDGAAAGDGSALETMDALAKVSDRYALDADAVSHLEDCNGLITGLSSYLGMIGVAALIIALVLGFRKQFAALAFMLRMGPALLLAVLVVLGLWGVIDFNGLFAAFHSLFFVEGTWTFNYDSLLISMYPIDFWMGMGAVWVGSAIGVKGAILPLVFGTVPFYTRQVEVALAGVNEGKVEAARSMGSGTLGLIFRVYLHEAVPELIRVTTVTAISLIGLTTMAGAVGAGGIGSFAINYGQNQNHQDIVNVCVVVLLIVVFILQSLGNALARRTTNRGLFRKVHK